MKKILLTLTSIFCVGSLFADHFQKIDDFESYTVGQAPAGANMPGPDGMPNPEEGPWWNHLDVVEDRATDPHIRVVEDPFNMGQGNVLEIYPGVPLSTSSLNHTITRSLSDDQSIKVDLEDLNAVSTFYFRVGRPLVDGVPGEADMTWGMVADTAKGDNPIHAYGSYSVLGRIEANGGIDIRDGGSYVNLQDVNAGEGLDTQTWYEIWFVVNHGANTFEQYVRGGTDFPVQTKMTWEGNEGGNAAYRNQTVDPLDTLLFITSAGNTDLIKGKDPMYLDDFYVDHTGRNLNTPGGFIKVDDFETYTSGQPPAGASMPGPDGMPNPEEGPWWNHLDVVEDRATDPHIRVVEDPFNAGQGNVLEIYPGVPLSTSSLNHTITRSLSDDQSIKVDLEDLNAVSTFYFRVGRPLVDGVPGEADMTWGMVADTAKGDNPIHAYGSYSVLGRIEANGGIDIRDGGSYVNLQDVNAGEGLDTQTWYEIWFVVNHGANTFEQYVRGGTDFPVQTKMTWEGNEGGNAAYRNQTVDPLDTLLFITSAGNTDLIKGKDPMYLDDFYVFPNGRNLNSPGVAVGEGEPPPPPPLLALDFEGDTVGEQPSVSDSTFSPSSNTATNGAVVIDSTSDPANPLSGKSLYIYDQAGDAPTHFRFPFNGGTNRSEVHLSFDFQRAYAATDTDTRVHVALGRVGDRLNNSDFRPFELRLRNDGTVRLNRLGGTTTIGTYNLDSANSINILANSHDTDSVDYDLPGLGSGTVAPNTLHLFVNGEKMGEHDFHVTPDPANAPEVIFNEQNDDLGQFALYQDTSRQGGIVFDNIKLSSFAPVPSGKFINISTRAMVGTGDNVMIGGFIVGEALQQVLVEAIGPELADRGVAGALADPVLTVTAADGTVLMVNDNWEDSQGQLVTQLWGGSPNLAAGSASSAAVLTLEPGNYTAKVEGKDGTTGVALVEVYQID